MNVDDNIIKGVAKFVSIVYESIEKYPVPWVVLLVYESNTTNNLPVGTVTFFGKSVACSYVLSVCPLPTMHAHEQT